jgi:prepilin-type N-terminal cleavage/methylation domain-containing protein
MAQNYIESRLAAGTAGRSGFTLMEILLASALLSIVAAASFGFLYWQMRTQAHVARSSLTMKRLNNAQTLVYKVLRAAGPASLTVDLSLIQYRPNAVASVDLFACNGSELLHNGHTVMENVVASFTMMTASAAPALALTENAAGLVRVELSSIIGRETQRISFIVRPRGYDNGL